MHGGSLVGRTFVPPRQQHQSQEFHDGVWDWLDSVSLSEACGTRVPVLQSCPHHIRGRFRQAVRQALELRSHAVRTQDGVSEVRGWKLFCLLPLMRLRREGGGSKVSKQELCRRFDLFVEGSWETLLHEAAPVNQGSQCRTNDAERRAHAACRKVQAGEVTRARQCLTGAAVAPGTDETFRALQSRRPQEVQRAIPREILEWEPESPVQIDRRIFMKSLKSSEGIIARARWVHLRTPSSVAGRGCHVRSVVRSSFESGAGENPCRNRHSFDGCTPHSVDKAGWRGPRNCHRLFAPKAGGQNLGKTICQGFRNQVRSVPVRSINQIRNGLRRPHAQSSH